MTERKTFNADEMCEKNVEKIKCMTTIYRIRKRKNMYKLNGSDLGMIQDDEDDDRGSKNDVNGYRKKKNHKGCSRSSGDTDIRHVLLLVLCSRRWFSERLEPQILCTLSLRVFQ